MLKKVKVVVLHMHYISWDYQTPVVVFTAYLSIVSLLIIK